MVQNTVLLGALAVFAYRDWKEKKVYLYALLFAGMIGLILHIVYQEHSIAEILAGAFIGAVMLLASYFSRGGIGVGDGAVLMVSGIYLGFWGNLELLFAALFLSGTAALFLLAVKKRKGDCRMPFVPFLLAAYLLVLL